VLPPTLFVDVPASYFLGRRLTGRLAPDFRTIADFRRGNGIRNVCRRFVTLCRELKLLSEAVVTIDGSKFKAVNYCVRNYTPGKIERNANWSRSLLHQRTLDVERSTSQG
jgi:hypothetical protein